jgi:hypothetical protein
MSGRYFVEPLEHLAVKLMDQWFCEPLVGSSNLSPGTNKIRHNLRFLPSKSSQKTALGRLWEDYNTQKKSSE